MVIYEVVKQTNMGSMNDAVYTYLEEQHRQSPLSLDQASDCLHLQTYKLEVVFLKISRAEFNIRAMA